MDHESTRNFPRNTTPAAPTHPHYHQQQHSLVLRVGQLGGGPPRAKGAIGAGEPNRASATQQISRGGVCCVRAHRQQVASGFREAGGVIIALGRRMRRGLLAG
ncbi:unnamed protein product [Ectocarpus sp. 13 AM-2016]